MDLSLFHCSFRTSSSDPERSAGAYDVGSRADNDRCGRGYRGRILSRVIPRSVGGFCQCTLGAFYDWTMEWPFQDIDQVVAT